MPHLPLGFPLPQCLVWESPHREIQNSTALELYSFFRVFGASTCLYSGLCCTQVTLGHGVTLVSGSAYARGVYTRRRHVWKLPSLVSHQTQDPKTLQCRVRKGAGRQSAVKCVSTYSGRLVSARHLYSATVEPGKAAQLCVFILGMRYFYLGVLSLCLGMGVPYILVSNMWHFAFWMRALFHMETFMPKRMLLWVSWHSACWNVKFAFRHVHAAYSSALLC